MLKNSIIITGMLVVFTIAGGSAVAQMSDIATPNPVPSMEIPYRAVQGQAYIDEVDGREYITRIDDNAILFHDTLLTLADNIQYYDINGIRTSRSAFRVGQPAAYVLNANGQIGSLWEVRERP